MLISLCNEKKYKNIFPPVEFCGDNAAMIAMVGLEKFKLKEFSDLDHPAKPRWPLDEKAAFLKGAGVKGAPWDGVRNYQAAKNLKSMKKGDQCFFYHSNIGKEIVGIVQVTKEHYIDKTDRSGRFVAVTVKFLKKLDKPVALEDIKKNKQLSHLSLIKQSRLSVMPIDSKSWKILNKMSKI